MTSDREQPRPTLTEQLGLTRDPFADTSSDFFFVGGQRRFLVQQAVHALYFAGGLVLLSGAEGAGKTRVLDEVCRELSELVDLCLIDASVLMDMNAIRARFAEQLGLSVDVSSDASLLAALNQLTPEAGDPLPVLLAIDDAHHLAVPVLVACHELVQASAGRIRLLLVGAPELLTAWTQVSADGEQLDVLPLDAQETLDYVATSLQAAGYRGENPLSDEQQGELYRKSRGNIGAIHALAPELLRAAIAGEPASASRRRGLPLQHIAIAVGLLLVVVALLFLFRGKDNGEAHDGPPAPMSTPAAVGTRQSVPLALPSLAPADTVPAAEAASSASAPVAPAAESPVPATIEPVPAVVPPAVAPTPVPEKPVAAKVAEPVAVKPEKPAPAKVEPAPVKAPAPAIAPEKSTRTAKAANAGNGLAAMPKDQFVVQLMAATSRPKLDDFLARSAKGVKVYTYATRRDGKPWHVAVTGPYATKAAARSAIAELPKALRDQSPWLRPVTSVHADLKAK